MRETLQMAFALRKAHNFREAIDIYTPLWNQDSHLFNDWDGWSYAFCLSKLNRHEEALEICRSLYPRFKTSEILNCLYAKCIYYTQFITDKRGPGNLRKAAAAIIQLDPAHNPYSYAPRAIFKLVKLLLNQQEIDWQEIEEWLLKLDPDLLGERPFSIVASDGKNMELASPKEEWFSNMIRVKGGLNRPKELLEILHAARQQNIRWHYNNDIWFARKEAFALKELHQKKEAEDILRKIAARKKDWFLLFDLAQTVEDDKERLQIMCEAALGRGKNEHKLKLFQALFELLKQLHPKEAGLHLCLVAAVREENGWEVKVDMQKEIREMNIDPVAAGSSSALAKKLTPFWKSQGRPEPGRTEGVVDVVFPTNKAGFIRDSKEKFYFVIGRLEGKIQKGAKVSFEVRDSFDKKRNRPGKMAVNIQIIK